MLLVVKIVLLVLLSIMSSRVMHAKQLDKSLKIKLDFLSWVQVLGVIALDILVLVSSGKTETQNVMLILAGELMIMITFFVGKRITLVGKDVLFIKEHSFRITDVSNVYYEKGKLTLSIQGTPVHTRFPIFHKETFLERFSGKQFRKENNDDSKQ